MYVAVVNSKPLVTDPVDLTRNSIPTPTRPTAEHDIDELLASYAACDGAELNSPNPRAVTAISAMRLYAVFIDIIFLSEVVKKTFSSTAGKD
jgi:hypothetical protein